MAEPIETRTVLRPAAEIFLAGGPGSSSRFVHAPTLAKALAGVIGKPRTIAKKSSAAIGELGRVVRGTSTVGPPRGDHRFSDEAWTGNGLFRRLMQTHVVLEQTVNDVLDEADLSWRADRQARYIVSNVFAATAPTNFPLTNPTVLKRVIDTGGTNFVAGARRFADDMSSVPRLPTTVDVEAFTVGEDLATTPGAVVYRDDVLEILQYEARTDEVHGTPVLIVPPTINKYYVLDLAPDRSFAAHLVEAGFSVFMVSWRNPDASCAGFDLDTYAQAVLDARRATAEIADSDDVHVVAACSGGIVSSAALGALAARDELDGARSLTLLVCALDSSEAGTTSALVGHENAAAAVALSAKDGYLDGKALTQVFAWLRPNDLIWRYVVDNYLLNKPLPAFDILFWNQDTVRLAAGLHHDFVRLALDNALVRPGTLRVLGRPVDLRDVDIDSYVVAGSADHIVPWESAYRSTHVLGGSTRFVLSTSGHIQALVNPPHPKSRSTFRVDESSSAPSDPGQWAETATLVNGSWWADHAEWLAARSGERVPAPKELGSAAHPPIGRAPGGYVLQD